MNRRKEFKIVPQLSSNACRARNIEDIPVGFHSETQSSPVLDETRDYSIGVGYARDHAILVIRDSEPSQPQQPTLRLQPTIELQDDYCLDRDPGRPPLAAAPALHPQRRAAGVVANTKPWRDDTTTLKRRVPRDHPPPPPPPTSRRSCWPTSPCAGGCGCRATPPSSTCARRGGWLEATAMQACPDRHKLVLDDCAPRSPSASSARCSTSSTVADAQRAAMKRLVAQHVHVLDGSAGESEAGSRRQRLRSY